MTFVLSQWSRIVYGAMESSEEVDILMQDHTLTLLEYGTFDYIELTTGIDEPGQFVININGIPVFQIQVQLPFVETTTLPLANIVIEPGDVLQLALTGVDCLVNFALFGQQYGVLAAPGLLPEAASRPKLRLVVRDGKLLSE
jgi:hypothetical protein